MNCAPMPPDDNDLWNRWDEVDHLLDAALELPADDRVHFVEEQTADDPDLRSTVLRLLGRLDLDDDSLTSPSGRLVREAFDSDRSEELQAGSMVGRYRIIERLGRGGMATVYSAERADGAYSQRVAIKVLRRGLDTDDLIERFLRERQILSSLSHPNIARILDGGSTDDGRPYLAMELVDGEPIITWADQHRLEVPERLRLFLAVADAVHAAHRQLVVHRDIKPSNVLVDRDGRVHLLDFGIAKLLDSDDDRTGTGLLPHTPSYASPEQLRGDAITTGTDVYQLGSLLFELLTGVRWSTFSDQSSTTSSQASRAALMAAPKAAMPGERAGSRGTTPERLGKQLTGDIDVIVGKALRDEPGERFASAAEMADDIRRHLAGLPISAHPESVAYRFRKFTSRNRWFIPTATIVVATIGLFVVMLVRHNHQLTRERDSADAALTLANETRGFLVDLFRSADPYAPADEELGRSITVVEALRLGRARLDSEFIDRPRLRASLLFTIGQVLVSLDQIDDAVSALEEALEIRTTIGDTVSVEFQDNLLALGVGYSTQGYYGRAAAVRAHELRLARQATPPDPARLSGALIANALSAGDANPRESIAFLEEAVEVGRSIGGVALAEALRKLADSYRSNDRLADAEAAAREALGIYREVEGNGTIQTAFAEHTLGQVLAGRGKNSEAGELLKKSLATLDRHLGPQHDLTMRMRNNLGVSKLEIGDLAAAESLQRELLVARRARYGELSSDVAGSYQNLAAALAGQRRYDEAIGYADTAEVLYRRLLPEDAPVIAMPLLVKAEAMLASNRNNAALAAARGAAAQLRGKVSPMNIGAIMADCRIGRALLGLGRREQARVLLDSALQRLDRAEGTRPSFVRECREARAGLGQN